MGAKVAIQARGRKIDLLGPEVIEILKGGRDVVVEFGAATEEDRILKTIHAVVGKHEVQLEIRHAEIREYLTHGMVGAVAGAGIAAAGVAVAALKAGATMISGPAALAIIGVGALLGSICGAATANVSRIVVYKYRGETRVKFIKKQPKWAASGRQHRPCLIRHSHGLRWCPTHLRCSGVACLGIQLWWCRVVY